MKRLVGNLGSLASSLARLPNLDRQELLDQWRRYYKTEPPSRISTQLLVYAIAYHMQEQALGGLKPATRRFLAKAADDFPSGQRTTALPQAIKPGTRLLREWHGVTHEVIVMESGALFQGKTYRSLSEVARTITGAHWSGPRFFGLKRNARDTAA